MTHFSRRKRVFSLLHLGFVAATFAFDIRSSIFTAYEITSKMRQLTRTKNILRIFPLFFGALSNQNSCAQKNASFFSSASAVQYGYSVKATFDISRVEKFSFRIVLSGGIGAFLGKNWLYPSLNADLMLYHGGMGSRRPGVKTGRWLDVESVISYSATAGFCNRMTNASNARPSLRSYPLYYFNNWAMPALQNPFRWSATFGGNIVLYFTRPNYKHQSVGFINLHFDRVQASYANDGPPFRPPFGDRFDRYHTGSGFISLHGDNHWGVNLIEVGYNKFTGYSPSAYELSNKIGSSYVFYNDPSENFYNKSGLYFTVANTEKRWGGTAIFYNYPVLDVQHRIHNNMYYPLHLVPYKKGVALGPVFYNQHTKIGLQ